MGFLCYLLLSTSILLSGTTVIDCGSATDSNFFGGSIFSIPTLPGDQTGRYDAARTGFTYTIPVVDTLPYILTLRFVEPSVRSVGQRIFSVFVNNQPVLMGLDLYAEAGFGHPTSRSFLVVGSAGMLVIRFVTSVRSALVSSIELTPLFEYAPPVDPADLAPQ